MYRKLLFFLIITLFISTAVAHAESEDVIHYNLSLAGYRLGMIFDDAAAIRPFQYIQNQQDSTDIKILAAFIDQVYIDGIETNLLLQFRADILSKIVVRFSPDAIEEMSQRFKQALGEGKNRSRKVTNHNGVETQQTICQWAFPNANLYLISISSNTEYATISLVKKRKERKHAPDNR